MQRGAGIAGASALTGSPRIRVQAVINLQSGGAAVPGGERSLEAIAVALARAGIDAAIAAVDPSDIDAAIARAVARVQDGAADAVVVGGGDGTIRSAAAAVAGTDIPLGILPLGTLNHFARDCGIPLELDAAAATIGEGRIRLVDVGDMNGMTFVNNSSIGIYPRVVLNRELLQRTHGLRKWPALAIALWRVLRAVSHRRLRVRIAARSGAVRTPLLFVGNNEYGTQVFDLGRRLRLDGGELWLYVVRPVGVLGLVQLAARMAFGLLDAARDLIVFKGTSATIGMRARRTLVALDGEVVSSDTPLRYAIRPKALAIIAP
jgi:diacylglycerol kinase family enzyme